MNAVTSGSLIISSEFNINEIKEFNLDIKKNCHTVARITGFVPAETGESPVFQKLAGSSVTVSAADENGNESVPPIFCGYIKNVEIWQEGNEYKARIEAISPTELLDLEEKSRSFQKIDMTYKELVRSVLSDTEKADVIFHIEDRKIEKPIYQYRETDWEFLKRIAGQLGTSLLPGGGALKPELYFGLPLGDSAGGKGIRPERIWFDKAYYTYDRDQCHLKKYQFICYEISSYESWKPGDHISMFDGGKTVVLSKRCSLENGLLVYHYIAGSPEAFGTAGYDNPQIAGVSLGGTVLERKQEAVRVKLDIDGEKPSGEEYWYPWMPETGNLMYCMPETGERITITFDDKEGNARASSCIRKNGTGNEEMGDPSKRYFTTAKDKRMYLLPDSLGFVDMKQKVPLKAEIHDRVGANIESSGEVTILARKGVWLKGSRVSFQAPQEISIVRRNILSPTVINMCNGFDSIGKFGKVKMEGSKVAGFPVFDSSDSETYDISGAENAVLASTPCAAGSAGLEQQITGTKVDMVKTR
ncbi:contractile injection system protein, VgrG/Pvc8 family [Lacrimispora indolis]|uniref:contractile injection system protein, VgrG/Pvc8 family n=1 Tax=Lacrimispora indolis TaxID=69825 RepID=UPI00040F5D38|nr:contractile injection system protein, VgrG/Pvc8 family [[Clostridium] methoxybenzovorans]